MDANGASSENDSIHWNTVDELETPNAAASPCMGLRSSAKEASTTAASDNVNVYTLTCPHFFRMKISFTKESTNDLLEENKMLSLLVDMGYSFEEALMAMENVVGSNAHIEELIDYISAAQVDKELDTGLEELPSEDDVISCSHPKALENSPEEHQCVGKSGNFGYESREDLLEEDKMLSLLMDMGYSFEEALMAMGKCGSNAHLEELTDYICAAQMDKELPFEDDVISCSDPKIRTEDFLCKKKRRIHPTEISIRQVLAADPPYFYYENVALTPKGVWSTISRFLYDVEPEFVDSVYFCATARKRGYIHNLPIHKRFPLLPRPPCTIQEALPSTKKWWPSWDARTKLNCLLTTTGTVKLTERIRQALEDCGGNPTPNVRKYVLDQCRRWNLVWVGKNKAAALEPDEMEMLLGFPKDHTRGGGACRQDRYKALGNSFQVDTVAYHLSVLKAQFPYGINVLSLFSGIGGAEVALHRLGIPLKNVVSVEISEVNRNILRSWWEQTNQRGRLIEIADVQEINGDNLERWISSFGGFDLVIGGPCNNLSGGNRVSRDGLEGKQSSLFYHYFRILELIFDCEKRSLLGCGDDLLKLFASYGDVEEFAKRKLDEFVFLGNRLQVSYAPHFESLSDTKDKLEGRRKEVLARLNRLPFVSGRHLMYVFILISAGRSKGPRVYNTGASSEASMVSATSQTGYICHIQTLINFGRDAGGSQHKSQINDPPITQVSSDQEYFPSHSMNQTVRLVREKLNKVINLHCPFNSSLLNLRDGEDQKELILSFIL
ncbi:hypothetical protein GH714_023514 [Hevea brasiliensis]|uniref:DNA (cytosine-5-)-methyltransferase n=1 Tax=Hevea brasiliensis TaxID=3981 RepID=A0A6A6KGL9_HEVBR|nr:hypothetical protein GH714_023514 [Hevea brasiliensis]